MDNKFYHSVRLDKEKCMGCINCIKRCPTEAIRVRDGKAKIINERCIDCGECIRVCQHRAKLAEYDGLDILNTDKYKIALPAPALFGQFNNIDDIDIILNGLIRIGFDGVFEVSRAAEIVSQATRVLIKQDKLKKPIISSACPTISRLIRVRFPNLVDNVLPIITPADLAAKLAKDIVCKEKGLKREDVVAVFISPCPAKVTSAKVPLREEKSEIDYVVAMKEVYPLLLAKMSVDGNDSILQSGRMGVSWATSGGEAAALLQENYLAADGIENVIRVLEDIEDEKVTNLSFVELNACSPGCVGGVLTVENPFVAKARIENLRKYLPVSGVRSTEELPECINILKNLEFEPVLELSPDIGEAMRMLKEMQDINKVLPGLDCGSCGAPSCKALSEDVVRGFADEDDCIFKLREHFKMLSDEIHNIERHIPAAFRIKGEK